MAAAPTVTTSKIHLSVLLTSRSPSASAWAALDGQGSFRSLQPASCELGLPNHEFILCGDLVGIVIRHVGHRVPCVGLV